MDRSTFFPTQLKSFGYKDSSFITNLFENQAEMVRYLQNKNEKLTQKLYELRNSNVNGYIMWKVSYVRFIRNPIEQLNIYPHSQLFCML